MLTMTLMLAPKVWKTAREHHVETSAGMLAASKMRRADLGACTDANGIIGGPIRDYHLVTLTVTDGAIGVCCGSFI